MPFKDKQKNRDYQKDWAKNNRASQLNYIHEIKIKAIEKLGGKCVNCGCDDIKALEFNHINGGGSDERRKNNGGLSKKLYLDIVAGRRNDIDLRCKVCNALHCLVEIKGLKNRWKIIYQ